MIAPNKLFSGSIMCLFIILKSKGYLIVCSKLFKGSKVPLASMIFLTPSYFRALKPMLGDKHHMFKVVFSF